MGRYFREEFSVLPEGRINVSYQVTSYLEANVGYSILYWNNVVRPGNQIDRVVDQGQVPTDQSFGTAGTRPAFVFHNTDYWAQGINFGLTFRY